MHLGTRVIWCYDDNAEVPDEYSNQQTSGITPQLIRSALDQEDAAPEVEDDAPVDNNSAELDEYAYRGYLNNPAGGRTGLSNLGNTSVEAH